MENTNQVSIHTLLEDLCKSIYKDVNTPKDVIENNEYFRNEQSDGHSILWFLILLKNRSNVDTLLAVESYFSLPLDQPQTLPMIQAKYFKLNWEPSVELQQNPYCEAMWKLNRKSNLFHLNAISDATEQYEHLLHNIDKDIQNTLQSICNSEFNDQKWTIISLPVRSGGLGIRKASEICLPTFLSSVSSVINLVTSMYSDLSDETMVSDYNCALEKWSSSFDRIPVIKTCQESWDNIVISENINSLTFNSETEKARFLASTVHESSAWITALPSKFIGTLLDNNTFRISVALRIGAKICKRHKCRCGEIVSEDGSHGLSCLYSSGRLPRHADFNNIIHRSLQSANVPSMREPPGMFRDDRKRVDGVTLIPWRNGQSMVWDATCSDTLAPSYLRLSSKSPGRVANKAANVKLGKYKKLIEDNYIIIPFAIETLGPWCTEAIKFIDVLGKLLANVTNEKKSKLYLKQRISIALQRSNAACIMGTFDGDLKKFILKHLINKVCPNSVPNLVEEVLENVRSRLPSSNIYYEANRWEHRGLHIPLNKETPPEVIESLYEKRFCTDLPNSALHLLALEAAKHQDNYHVLIIDKKRFNEHVKLLLIGIESESFLYDSNSMTFSLLENLTIENVTPKTIAHFVLDFVECGSCYKRLKSLISTNTLISNFTGIVFKVLCSRLNKYLETFRSAIIIEKEETICELYVRVSPLIKQVRISAKLLAVHPNDASEVMAYGSQFLGYLYKQISRIVPADVYALLVFILSQCCDVYFRRFSNWIYHGIIEDPGQELFIEFQNFYIPKTKSFFDKAFVMKAESHSGHRQQ